MIPKELEQSQKTPVEKSVTQRSKHGFLNLLDKPLRTTLVTLITFSGASTIVESLSKVQAQNQLPNKNEAFLPTGLPSHQAFEAQATITPTPTQVSEKRATLEQVSPIHVTFVDSLGKNRDWNLNPNFTWGIPPNDTTILTDTIIDTSDGTLFNYIQEKQSLYSGLHGIAGVSLAGFTVNVPGDFWHMVTGTTDNQGLYHLHVEKASDINNPNDFSKRVLFTEDGDWPPGPLDGRYVNVTYQIKNNKTYLQVIVDSSINTNQNGIYTKELDAQGNEVGTWIKIASPATATATITATATHTPEPTKSPTPIARFKLFLPTVMKRIKRMYGKLKRQKQEN